jgi:hypothetical protein
MASPDQHAIQEGFTNDVFESTLNQFVDSQYVYFPDYNQSNYSSGIIRFDTLACRDQFVIWSDSYLQIPISLGSSTSPSYQYAQADPVGFKNSVLDMITGVQINSGSGQTLVNDNNVQYINNLRLLLETAYDAEVGNLADIQFWKNDLPPASGLLAGDWTNGANAWPNPAVYNVITPDTNQPVQAVTAATSIVAGSAPTNTGAYWNSAFNEGFSKRVQFFKLNATFAGSSATSWQLIVNIPLKFLHKFFEQLNFPLLNCRWQFNFTTPLIAPSTTPSALAATYQPFMVGYQDGATTTAVPAPAAAIGNSYLTQCRIYYRKVTYGATLNEKLNKMLQQGYKKVIEYPVTDFYNSLIAANDASTASRILLVSSSTVAPLRVWVLPVPTGQATSSTIPFICPANGATPGNNEITNANILINNVPYFYNNLVFPREFYTYLQENSVASGFSETVGSLISYRDFLNLHNYTCFDVHRLKDRLGDPNEAVTIQLNIQRNASPTGYSVDWLVLVERKQVCVLSISSSGTELAIGSATSG